ncbi:ATP-binding cassette domain-containing protein [Psychromonas ossibalaenae]|uniref:ATP-binding cassette domain-containing protein n=1 Tax=Psychromonas ossibalaenae TaxID=444922 RepID=UPI00037EA95F|nr:ABC transporter ATP-binding protein [Psychromonas ossibalaenae]
MQTLLNVSNLCKNYKRSARFSSSGFRKALGPLNFTLERGKTLAIVGESGAGKSTLVQIIAGLIKPSSGEIYVKDKPLSTFSQQERCTSIRMIFQDPSSSLNPKATIGRILAAPLELNTPLTLDGRKKQILDTLNLVGLLPDYLDFYPNMLSGIQQHQVAMARALILKPDIIIADEILASLDISLRFKIVNLLLNIQEKIGVSFIFVAHNMNLVRHMSDQIVVMENGMIVENNTTEKIYKFPQSAVTKQLLQSHQPHYRKER